MIWPHFQRNFLTEQNETIKATFCVLSDQNSLRLYFLCYEPTEPNISQPMYRKYSQNHRRLCDFIPDFTFSVDMVSSSFGPSTNEKLAMLKQTFKMCSFTLSIYKIANWRIISLLSHPFHVLECCWTIYWTQTQRTCTD